MIALLVVHVGLSALEAPAPAPMPEHVRTWFEAEKQEGALFMGLGGASLAGGGVLVTRDASALRGSALPLIGVGLIQLGVGLGVFLRTDRQRAELLDVLQADPARFAALEGARMDRVGRWFAVYKVAEAALVAGGLGAAAYGVLRRDDLALGIGVGLAVQAAILLVLDLFAEARAHRYRAQILELGF